MEKKYFWVLVIGVIFIVPSSLPVDTVAAEDVSLSIDSVEWGYVRLGLWAFIKSKVTLTLTNHGSADITIAKMVVSGSFLYEEAIEDTLGPKETKAYELVFVVKRETMDIGNPFYILRLTTYLIWKWDAEYTVTILTSEGLSVSETCLTPPPPP